MVDSHSKPVIGITPNSTTDTLDHGTFDRYVLARTYADAVHAAGGISVILTPNEDDVESLLDRMDGILLSGGSDLDPRRYGDETRHPTTYGIDAERNGFEFELAHMARARDLPLLGICRGIQSLNVAFGGTLF